MMHITNYISRYGTFLLFAICYLVNLLHNVRYLETTFSDAVLKYHLNDNVTQIISISKSASHNSRNFDVLDSMQHIMPTADNNFDITNEVNTNDGSYTNGTIIVAPNQNTAYLTMYGPHRADKSFSLLPKWLQTYFEWHGEQTRNPSQETKYIVIICHGRKKCGGVSDRLRPLPFYLLFASLVPRVLCIHWTRPFTLENYLMPPVGSGGRVVDWRCPPDVYEEIDQFRKHGETTFLVGRTRDQKDFNELEKEIQRARMLKEKYIFLGLESRAISRVNCANLLFQMHTYTETMPHINNWEYPDLIADIFRVMFEPMPNLAQSTNITMTRLGLIENEYVSVHVRSRYPIIWRGKKFDFDHGGLVFEGEVKKYLRTITRNAVKCANDLAKNSTIYFASDSHEVVADTTTRDLYFKDGTKVRPVGIHRKEELLHSDGTFNETQISDFNPLFEDLLIMGGSKCVAHGIGSFGAFGAGISGNRCRAIHRKHNGVHQPCPNDRADKICLNITEFYNGTLLFDFEKDRQNMFFCDAIK